MQAIAPEFSLRSFQSCGTGRGKPSRLKVGLNAGSALDEVRDKAMRSLLAQEQDREIPEKVVQESKQ